MSSKGTKDRLDKIIKRLDILTIVLLAQSGLPLRDIAKTLGVSEDTVERTVLISKIKRKTDRKVETKSESLPSVSQKNTSEQE